MERLDVIEKKMLTEEHIENWDKKMHNFATMTGSNAEEVFKFLKEQGPQFTKELKKVCLGLIN